MFKEIIKNQKKLLNSESKIVLLNGGRACGKTCGIIGKALKVGGNWVFVTENRDVTFRIINEAIKDITAEYKEEVDIQLKGFNFVFYEDKRKNIVTKIMIISNIDEVRGMSDIDYLIFDGVVEFNREIYNCLKYQVKQVILSSNENLDIEVINMVGTKKNEESWKVQELKKLMKEFSLIPNAENTTKTRQIILDMIMKIKEM